MTWNRSEPFSGRQHSHMKCKHAIRRTLAHSHGKAQCSGVQRLRGAPGSIPGFYAPSLHTTASFPLHFGMFCFASAPCSPPSILFCRGALSGLRSFPLELLPAAALRLGTCKLFSSSPPFVLHVCTAGHRRAQSPPACPSTPPSTKPRGFGRQQLPPLGS